MTAMLAVATAALRLVQPMCEADTRPTLVVEHVTNCAGRTHALGCFRAETPGRIYVDPATPAALVAKVVIHEATHRSLYLCGGRWRDERLVARLTREALS